MPSSRSFKDGRTDISDGTEKDLPIAKPLTDKAGPLVLNLSGETKDRIRNFAFTFYEGKVNTAAEALLKAGLELMEAEKENE